tara:strand:+ start:94084 stop:95241 length:1158 start_codon:yes stop_codon:yes gene_type:complete
VCGGAVGSAGEAKAIFAPSLERLAPADPSDYAELSSARDEWAKIFAESFDHFDAFFALIVAAGEAIIDEQPQPDVPVLFTRAAAVTFLAAASDSSYLSARGSIPAIGVRLADHNEMILALVRRMTAAAKRRPDFAAPADALISLYFHHSDHDSGLRAGVVRVIPDTLRAFPEHRFAFALFLLAHSSSGATELSRLLTFRIVERGEIDHPDCHEVATATMGLASRPGSRLYDSGASIMGPVAGAVRDRRPEALDRFVETFVLSPLDCSRRDRDAELARIDAELARLSARLESFGRRLGSPTPVTAQDTPLVLDISQGQEERERILADFDEVVAARWDMAVRQLAAQPARRATLEAIRAGLAPLSSRELDRLLADAANVPDRADDVG